jgi:hypothetical protein
VLGALAQRHELSLEKVLELLGEKACDIYLNSTTFWAGVPSRVWDYTLGGYAVFKKWLSYREHRVLERPLNARELRYFSEVVRRVVEILANGPALDASHAAVTAEDIKWKDGRPVDA